MRRRQFLGLLAALAAAGAAAPAAPAAPPALAADRLTWWDPAPSSTSLGSYVALEWRYLAGRISEGDQDFGFVISLADYNPLPPLNNTDFQELLVMREDFTGAQTHATRTYRGALAYDTATATYSFSVQDNPAISVVWRLDAASQTYTLSVATPELTLGDLLLTPQGDLIAEGGDGAIASGTIRVRGLAIDAVSDYYADWVALSRGSQTIGLARLDMQTIRPVPSGGEATGFAHHWFCLACTLEDDTPAWVSAWQIVSGGRTVWCVTRATGRGPSWDVGSTTEEGFGGVQPLAVQILDWQRQPVPSAVPAQRTGRRWRLTQGNLAAGDAVDIEIAVADGQFISGARISTDTSIPMQEAVGTTASGSVGGRAIKSVAFAAAESTYSEDARTFLPAVLR